MYVLHQVFGNIRRHFLSCILILLQLTVVMTFLFYTVNLLCSLKDKSDRIADEIAESNYMLIAAKNTEEPILFDREKIAQLNREYAPDIELSHVYYYRFWTTPDPRLEGKRMYVIFCDTTFLQKIIGLDTSLYPDGTCFVGEESPLYLSEFGDRELGRIILRASGEIQADDTSLPVERLDSINKIISVSQHTGADFDIQTSKCIFVPDTYDVRDEFKMSESLFVFFPSDYAAEATVQTCRDIINYLETDSNVTYRFDSRKRELEYQYVIVNEETDIYVFLTAMSLFIIVFAIGGLKIIQIYRDKKRIAISMALGASPGRMLLEITGDTILTQAVAVLLGVLFGSWICSHFPHYMTEIHLHPIGYLSLILTAILSYAISYAIMRNDFLKIRPVTILK